MHRLFYIFLILALIALDIFLFPVSSDIRIFGILLLYMFLIKTLKLTSKTTFMLALVLLVFAYIQYVFSNPADFFKPIVPSAERAAVWVYLFLVIGVIQKWRE